MDRDLLVRVACWKRYEFFKLWNQFFSSDDRMSVEDRLSLVLERFQTVEMPPLPRIPSFIRFISLLDSEYPKSFFELPQPPLGVFVQGEIRDDRVRAAVVGSRKPLPYSRRVTREVVRLWAAQGYSIVSGGAIGIDGDAHQACLEAQGHTIAILGGGILRPHPRSHHLLFKQILASGGALLSEYPPDFEPRPYTFPERNRLIAALSDLLFLAQAHEKSGSMGTAKVALDLGREIYVLRPVLGDTNFAGSQALIDAGAKVLIDAHELEAVCVSR